MEATNREIWRSMDGYANYEVSCFGRVRNAATERILKLQCKREYRRVALHKDDKPKQFFVHRLVAREFLDNPQGKSFIDHVDGNKSNNIVENLRWATSSENNRNRMKRQDTSSDFKGVSFAAAKGKWLASIKPYGKSKHLGYFESEKDAAKAYNEAAARYFGEYAKLNEID